LHKSKIVDQFHLHFIVVIFAFTGILGKLITVDALHLVTVRMFLASLGLYILYLFKKNKGKGIKPAAFFKIAGIGVLVALHWFTFYHAIKISNVSIALASFSTTTLFTSLIEPLIEKRKVYWIEVVIGIIIVFGLVLIFQFETQFYMGILVGIVSAFLISLATVLNRQMVQHNDYTLMSVIELGIGFLFLYLIFIFETGHPTAVFNLSKTDFMWLLVLAWVCTSYAFTAVMELMQRISAYKVNLAISLEPVYGIILALLIFGESEKMSTGFYFGALIVFAAVFSYPFLMARFGNDVS